MSLAVSLCCWRASMASFILQRLNQMVFKPDIIRLDSIDSTNLEAMRRAKAGAPEGLCIVAREQTRGRGRLDRSWHSPKDAGLYLSVMLRPKFDMARWPLISLAAALAVAQAIEKTCDLRVDIKWPNDILFDERKLCGILSETVETAAGPAAIVGIGINLTEQSFPLELATATSIESATGVRPDPDPLLDELLRALEQKYETLSEGAGAEQLIREWCARSSYAFDRRVRVSIGDEGFEGITCGLESDGALRVELDDGEIKAVRAGDVTAVRAFA